MNILFLCDEYPQCKHGGIGTVTRILARELARKGHNVTVCGFYPYYRNALRSELDNGVMVYRYFYGNWLSLKLSKRTSTGRIYNLKRAFAKYLEKVKMLIEQNKIEIIEIPDYNEIFRYTGPEFVSFPDFGIPRVVKIHGGDSFFSYIKSATINRGIVYLKEKSLLEESDSIIAISDFSRNIIREIYSYEREIPVIYNGIDTNKSADYHEEKEKISVVFAGTITEKKGIFSLVRAWKDVVNKVPAARLYIFGKGSERTLQQLKALIGDEIRSSVNLMGFTDKDKIGEIYQSATCAVFPSFAESFGMAPLEAMVTGCPTIFTRRTSGPELITHGLEGILVDPENLQDISDSILFLINNREKALEMGRNGALKVKSHFSIDLIADQHIALYDKLIKERGKS
jgi:glycogen synthase